jgi:phosphoglycerate kinase
LSATASGSKQIHLVQPLGFAGLLMEAELKHLSSFLTAPEKPYVAVLGGAKVSDKIKVIDRLLDKADTVLIGGAMASTFKLAHGGKTGKSLVEKDHTGTALAAEEKAKSRKVAFHLPTDTVIATPVDTGKVNKKGRPVYDLQNPRVVSGDIPDDAEGFDIGPATAQAYAAIIAGAGTVLWNGPMGMFEDARFAEGTIAVAKALAEATTRHGTKSIIGGGDSVKAVNKAGLDSQMTFMSTGGGASLEFLEGIPLPGLSALDNK